MHAFFEAYDKDAFFWISNGWWRVTVGLRTIPSDGNLYWLKMAVKDTEWSNHLAVMDDFGTLVPVRSW